MQNEEGEIIPVKLPQKPLTPETLRTYKGYENVSDEVAADIILSLHAFAALVFEYCQLKQKQSSSEIIDINYNNQKQAA